MTNSHATQSGILQTRPLKQNSTLFCYSTQADFIPLTILYFFFSLILTGLIDYIKIHIQLKEAKQFHNADDNQQTAIKGTEQRPKLETTCQSWQSTLEHRSGPSLSLTTP